MPGTREKHLLGANTTGLGRLRCKFCLLLYPEIGGKSVSMKTRRQT